MAPSPHSSVVCIMFTSTVYQRAVIKVHIYLSIYLSRCLSVICYYALRYGFQDAHHRITHTEDDVHIGIDNVIDWLSLIISSSTRVEV